ncbi:MAG TPA: galactose oxidase-like domain-containing protein [Thermoleophilaceae bacterium]|nr:galactose oxidase-like domain-containing protein [Thermoleophilaceae bacterium]
MDSHAAINAPRGRTRRGALVLAALAVALTAAAPAADARSHRVSESTARTLETQTIGPAHAREHAAERRMQRRAIRRWRALSSRQRARFRRMRRATLHAASDTPKSEVGSWDPTPFQLPVHAIHSAVLPTGKVMIWSSPFQATNDSPRLLETHAYIWDPSQGYGAGAFHEVSPPGDETAKHAMIFCGGGSLLEDGRLLTTGGTLYWPDTSVPGKEHWAGIKDVWTFDPWTETWTRQPDTRVGRWYPTQTELADGRTVILGGYDEHGQQDVNTDLEVFTPSPDPHGVGKLDRYPDAAFDLVTIYPHLFTLPDGNVLMAGPTSYENALLSVDKDHFGWTNMRDSQWRTLGTAFLEPGSPAGSTRVTLVGGMNPDEANADKTETPARATTETIDAQHASDGWKAGPSMHVPRANFNTVTLPDGSVVAMGGSNGIKKYGGGLYTPWDDNRSRQVEIRDRKTKEWRLGPAQQEDRAYHSTAVLLPDGRILSGGDDRSGSRTSDTGEIYSPPYLFRGDRPLIGAAPQKVGYGLGFHVGASGGATRAVLMAPGVTTHGTEMQARHVELAVTHRGPGGLDVLAPPSGGVAPPGWYMLFVLNADDVPSVARWVHVEEPPPGSDPPDPPVTLPHFGAATKVSVVTKRARVRGRTVELRVLNGNRFDVPASATLRLRKGLTTARLSPAARTDALLPGRGRATLTLRLGNKKAKQIRRLGHLGGRLQLVVTDPAGHRRTVGGAVRVWAKQRHAR